MSPRPKVALNKNEIIMAAAEVANEYGNEHLTLALLAKRLGIKPPSLYNHFDGISGVKRELAILSLANLYEGLAEACTDSEPGEERVMAISDAYLTFSRSSPGLYEAALAAPDPSDEQVFLAGKKIVDLVLSAMKPFNLTEEAALHAVRGLRSIMHGFASLEQKGAFGMPLHVDESYKLTVQSFLRGQLER